MHCPGSRGPARETYARAARQGLRPQAKTSSIHHQERTRTVRRALDAGRRTGQQCVAHGTGWMHNGPPDEAPCPDLTQWPWSEAARRYGAEFVDDGPQDSVPGLGLFTSTSDLARCGAPEDRFPSSGRSFPVLQQISGGQGEAAAHEVDLDDPYGDLIAFAHDLAGVLDVLVTELGDVYESLDAVGDADEGSERNQLGDLPGRDHACLVRERYERILVEGFQRQLDLSTASVYVDDLADNPLAGRDGVCGMVDSLPAQFWASDEPGALIGWFAVEVHEHTEVVDALHPTLVCCTAPKAKEEGSQSLVLTCRSGRPDALLLPVDGYHFEGELLPDAHSFGRMPDGLAGQIAARDTSQCFPRTREPVQFDERSPVLDADDAASADFAGPQVVQKVLQCLARMGFGHARDPMAINEHL